MKPINTEKLELFHQGMKRCRTCKQVKPHSEFTKRPSNWDKLRDQCKECNRAEQKSKRILKWPTPPDGHRWCRRCKTVKPLSDFNKGAQKHGTQAKCRDCQKQVNLQYMHSPHGKAKRKQWQHSEQGKEAMRKGVIAARTKHPNACKARNAVNNAVRSGKLPSVKNFQCTHCNKPAMHYHHYAGYDPQNWLKVEPVCIACHKLLD